MNKKDRQAVMHELDRETEYYSEHTRRQYFSHVSDYLDYVDAVGGDWKDRDTVYDYQKKLKARGHSQAHINYLMRGPVGAIFRAHGLLLPIKLPRVKMAMLDLEHRVKYTKEEVSALISGARSSGNPVFLNLMALSTMYGLRATEMRLLRKEDTHPKKRTVFIHTLKGGLDREHTVPDVVAPYIFGYEYPLFSENKIYELFMEIADKAGVDRPRGKAYHAIRHALASELIYDKMVDDKIVFQFLRWQGGTVMSIYATPYQPKIDKQIFDNHPFLEFWE